MVHGGTPDSTLRADAQVPGDRASAMGQEAQQGEQKEVRSDHLDGCRAGSDQCGKNSNMVQLQKAAMERIYQKAAAHESDPVGFGLPAELPRSEGATTRILPMGREDPSRRTNLLPPAKACSVGRDQRRHHEANASSEHQGVQETCSQQLKRLPGNDARDATADAQNGEHGRRAGRSPRSGRHSRS